MKFKVNLSNEIGEKLKSLSEREGKKPEELIIKIITEYVSQHWSDESPFSKEEEEKVKERLRSLGYLD